jgi:hypothetical protein
MTFSTQNASYGLELEPLIQIEIVSCGRTNPRIEVVSKGASTGDHSGKDSNILIILFPV